MKFKLHEKKEEDIPTSLLRADTQTHTYLDIYLCVPNYTPTESKKKIIYIYIFFFV